MIQAKEYQGFIKETLEKIMSVDSPTGFSKAINETLNEIANGLGYQAETTNKRLVKISVKGKSSDKKIAVSAHVDTLGAIVRSVTGDGKIRFSKLGGPILPTLDGEYCKVYADGGKVYSGTILCDSCSCHVYKDASTAERTESNMYVRLDEEISCVLDVEKLGIRTGSIIAFDTKTTFTDSGFVKSRFLDDKAGSVCLLTVLSAMQKEKIQPQYDVDFYFTNYEEVGHGAATVGMDADEL
ncbi:MAG: aminopeptidase, partial [Clostridia bacterium]|nr:aminopeptidase [Clostridia bacterium]